jgi:hypothetical protein
MIKPMAKQTMTIDKVKENGSAYGSSVMTGDEKLESTPEKSVPQKTNAQQCAEEIEEIYKKYNCEPVCHQQLMFGQIVWVPGVREIKKQS